MATGIALVPRSKLQLPDDLESVMVLTAGGAMSKILLRDYIYYSLGNGQNWYYDADSGNGYGMGLGQGHDDGDGHSEAI